MNPDCSRPSKIRYRTRSQDRRTIGIGSVSGNTSVCRHDCWTRSENHLTALFFAVKDSPKAPVVFVYHARKSQIVTSDEKKASPFSISITRIMKPKPPNIRATLQEAWHTVHKIYRVKGREIFRPLTDMRIHDSRTDIIKINPASAKRIQGELKRLLGITRATLYGEFDSICESIRHDFGML